MNENALIIFIKSPVAENLSEKAKANFDEKMLLSIYIETAQKTFAKISALENIKIIPVYEKISRYPDLRWLSSDDPGFLPQRGANNTQRLKNSVNWVFDTGAKTVGVVYLDMFYINSKWILHAFQMLKQKHIVLGACKNEEYYFMGFNKSDNIILKELDIHTNENVYSSVEETCKKLKLSIHMLSETYKITNERAYHQWLVDTKKIPQKSGKNELFGLNGRFPAKTISKR